MVQMLSPVPYYNEPKRKNRWYIEFPGLDFSEWMVQTSSRPTATINETEIQWMNTSKWVAGRSVWETLDITFIDAIGPSTSQKVMDWVRLCVEHTTGKMGYASNYKQTVILKLLDPVGETVEKWTINGAFITTANFGDLDMSSDDLVNVTITIRYDDAVLNF